MFFQANFLQIVIQMDSLLADTGFPTVNKLAFRFVDNNRHWKNYFRFVDNNRHCFSKQNQQECLLKQKKILQSCIMDMPVFHNHSKDTKCSLH